jgi:hypothetical protein
VQSAPIAGAPIAPARDLNLYEDAVLRDSRGLARHLQLGIVLGRERSVVGSVREAVRASA